MHIPPKAIYAHLPQRFPDLFHFDPFAGTEELGHLEMVAALVHQLTDVGYNCDLIGVGLSVTSNEAEHRECHDQAQSQA